MRLPQSVRRFVAKSEKDQDAKRRLGGFEVRRETGEPAVERADRGAGGAGDDNVAHDGSPHRLGGAGSAGCRPVNMWSIICGQAERRMEAHAGSAAPAGRRGQNHHAAEGAIAGEQ